ncbi:hypothetical protein KIPB_010181, partial [Kipferlia bialata]|eukprot:g10181.t1
MLDGTVIHMPTDRFEREGDGARVVRCPMPSGVKEIERHAHPVCGVGLLPEPFSQAPSALNMPRYMSVGSPPGLRVRDIPFPAPSALDVPRYVSESPRIPRIAVPHPADDSECETPHSLFPLPSVGPGHMQYNSVDAYLKVSKHATHVQPTYYRHNTPVSLSESVDSHTHTHTEIVSVTESEREGEREVEVADSDPMVPQVMTSQPSLPFRYTLGQRDMSSVPSSARTDGPPSWRAESNSPRSARSPISVYSQISSGDTVDEEEIGGRGGGAERDLVKFKMREKTTSERERERERERETDIEDYSSTRPQYCIDQSRDVQHLKEEMKV